MRAEFRATAYDGNSETYHETDFKEIRSNTHEDMDLAEEVEVERRHPIVVGNTREKVHENQLTVALASVAGLLVCGRLPLGPAFHHDDCGGPSASDG